MADVIDAALTHLIESNDNLTQISEDLLLPIHDFDMTVPGLSISDPSRIYR